MVEPEEIADKNISVQLFRSDHPHIGMIFRGLEAERLIGKKIK